MEGYLIILMIVVLVISLLAIKWASSFDNSKRKTCERCDPNTCPFPLCDDCQKAKKAKTDK